MPAMPAIRDEAAVEHVGEEQRRTQDQPHCCKRI